MLIRGLQRHYLQIVFTAPLRSGAGLRGLEPETSCFELHYLFNSKSSNWFILSSYV
jgi:hypothetical protein